MGVYSKSSLSTAKSTTPVVESSDHILDLMIENAQNDMKMFDSVIELDFMQAYNEAGMISINEADTEEKAKASIGQKIKDLFTKLSTFVKNAVSTFLSKLQNMFSNDAKLVKSYGDKFSKAAGYKLKNFTPIRELSAVQSSVKSVLDLVDTYAKDAQNKINKAADADAINAVLDEYKKQCSEMEKDLNFDKAIFNGDKKEDYELTSKDISAIESVMKNGGKNVINSIKNIRKEFDSSINAMKSAANVDKFTAKAGDDKLGVSKANAVFKVCNTYSSALTKMTNAACSATSKYVAAARRAFVAAGKGTNEETIKAECGISMAAYDAILCEASDSYVESALAMV